MAAPQMLVQIFLSGEADPSASLAVLVRTHASSFGTTMLTMDFSLVAEKPARVGEATDVVAFGFIADVRPGVLVHVLSVIDRQYNSVPVDE